MPNEKQELPSAPPAEDEVVHQQHVQGHPPAEHAPPSYSDAIANSYTTEGYQANLSTMANQIYPPITEGNPPYPTGALAYPTTPTPYPTGAPAHPTGPTPYPTVPMNATFTPMTQNLAPLPQPGNSIRIEVVRGTTASRLGRDSIPCVCPNCHQNIMTRPVSTLGNQTWIFFLIILVLGFVFPLAFCCLCLPFCTDNFKDTTHICPNCKAVVGVCKNSNGR
uniref:LITAF domain-containing protein n=1 Tax=Rhabditophanes sp. KR3021 TaxID=114890 RepID=A0AC35TR06_9BILA